MKDLAIDSNEYGAIPNRLIMTGCHTISGSSTYQAVVTLLSSERQPPGSSFVSADGMLMDGQHPG